MQQITKESLMKEIIKNDIFIVANSPDKDKWIPLKNGSRTPLFLDTSKFNSYPELTERINLFIIQLIKDKNIKFDRLVGIPYGGILFSCGLFNILKVPCLTLRKEGKKNYSTKGDILGIYEKGDRLLLLEDATVTADTALEFVHRLRQEELVITDLITIIDIEKTAESNLKKEGVKLQALFTWKELYEFYKKEKPVAITNEMKKVLDEFISK
jgi:orotate phosphoribosyltransferase